MNLLIPLSPAHQKEKKLETIICGKTVLEHIKSNFPDYIKVSIINSDDTNKYGPIYTIKKYLEENNIEGDIFIQYCDLINFFDFEDCSKKLSDLTLFASNIIHPFREGSLDYSFVKIDPFQVQEKKSFTAIPEEEYVTTGIYHFKNKEILLDLIEEFDNDDSYSREHKKNRTCNIEQLYNLSFQKGKDYSLNIYTDYITAKCDSHLRIKLLENWIHYFSAPRPDLNQNQNYDVVIPLAGKGSRFKERGYKKIKPLLDVDGKSLIEFVSDSIPQGQKYHFVVQKDHIALNRELKATLEKYPQTELTEIDHMTEGQACSAMLAVEKIHDSTPIFVGVCDNTAIWNYEKFKELIEQKTDIIYLSFKNHPNMISSPHYYGWMETDSQGFITDISCKKPISDNPIDDDAIVGMFYFREAKIFKELYKKMKEIDYRINNEFYVDTLIAKEVNKNYKARVLEVNHFLSFGTPNEYTSYFYWKKLASHFNKGI